MKKLTTIVIAMCVMLTIFTGCGNTENPTVNNEKNNENTTNDMQDTAIKDEVTDPVDVNIANLKGPTAMGMVNFMFRVHTDEIFNHNYNFSIITATDEVTTNLIKEELDIASVPANLASVLYNNTDGSVQVIAINTLGVLYILENGDSITDIDSLRGKTIISAGKGGTPEMSLRYVLLQNGIDPDVDVTIEWKSEQSECLAYLTTTQNAIVMMPEPFVTTALLTNENINVKLDLTKEWDKVQDSENPSSLITGVVVARTDFVSANPNVIADFLENYKKSVEDTLANVLETAYLVAEYDITPFETAEIAIPNCNIVCITGEEMKTALEGYLTVLHEQNPTSVGGALPNSDFYYGS